MLSCPAGLQGFSRKKANGAKKFSGVKTFRSWSTLRQAPSLFPSADYQWSGDFKLC